MQAVLDEVRHTAGGDKDIAAEVDRLRARLAGAALIEGQGRHLMESLAIGLRPPPCSGPMRPQPSPTATLRRGSAVTVVTPTAPMAATSMRGPSSPDGA